MPGTDVYYPGTQIIEKPFQPARQQAADIVPQAAFIGRIDQGPLEASPVSTWSQFQSLYGSIFTSTHYAVSDFFSNGGRLAHVVRIPGTGAASSTVAVPGIAPTTTIMTVVAKNPGLWGNQLRVVFTWRATDKFDLAVYKVPSGFVLDPTKRNSDYLLEQWVDLSMYTADSRYYQDVINAPSTSSSAFVTVSGQSDVANLPVASTAPLKFDLAGGTDGVALTNANDQAAYTAAFAKLSPIEGPLVLNLPNVIGVAATNNAAIVKSAIDYAVTRGCVFVIVDPPFNATSGDMVTFVETTLALSSIQASYAAVYWPWVNLPAVASAVSGKVTLRAPGGAVAGVFAAVDTSYGVWRAPAGPAMRLAGAVGIERALTDADLSLMNSKHVNAIRDIPGTGVVIMGARTFKRSGLDMYINNRRTVQYLREALKRATEYALFSPNDERLWIDLSTACNRVLGKFWTTGGLKGKTAGEAYFVKCDATNNVPSTAAGQTNVEVGINLAEPAEFIVITIGHYDGQSAISTSI